MLWRSRSLAAEVTRFDEGYCFLVMFCYDTTSDQDEDWERRSCNRDGWSGRLAFCRRRCFVGDIMLHDYSTEFSNRTGTGNAKIRGLHGRQNVQLEFFIMFAWTGGVAQRRRLTETGLQWRWDRMKKYWKGKESGVRRRALLMLG